MLIFNKLHRYITSTFHITNKNVRINDYKHDHINIIEKYTRLNTYLVGIYPEKYNYNFVIYNLICGISRQNIQLYNINNMQYKDNILIYSLLENSNHVNCSYTLSDILVKDNVCIQGYPDCLECHKNRHLKFNDTISNIVKSMTYQAIWYQKYQKIIKINKQHKHKSFQLIHEYTFRLVYVCDDDWNIKYIEYQRHTINSMIYVKYSFDKINIRHMDFKTYNYNSYYNLISDKHYIKI